MLIMDDDEFRHFTQLWKRKQIRWMSQKCKKQLHFPKTIRAMKYSKSEKRVVNANMLLENKVPLVNKQQQQQQQQPVIISSSTVNNNDKKRNSDYNSNNVDDDNSINSNSMKKSNDNGDYHINNNNNNDNNNYNNNNNKNTNVVGSIFICLCCRNYLSAPDQLCSNCMKQRFCKHSSSATTTTTTTSSTTTTLKSFLLLSSQEVVRVQKPNYNGLFVSKLRNGEHYRPAECKSLATTTTTTSATATAIATNNVTTIRTNDEMKTRTTNAIFCNNNNNVSDIVKYHNNLPVDVTQKKWRSPYLESKSESAATTKTQNHKHMLLLSNNAAVDVIGGYERSQRCSPSIQSSSCLASILNRITSLTPVSEITIAARKTKPTTVTNTTTTTNATATATTINTSTLALPMSVSIENQVVARRIHKEHHTASMTAILSIDRNEGNMRNWHFCQQQQQQQQRQKQQNNSQFYCNFKHSSNQHSKCQSNEMPTMICKHVNDNENSSRMASKNHVDNSCYSICNRVKMLSELMHTALKMYHILILCVQIAVLNIEQNNKCTFNKRQQCPPSSRLTLNYNNSYNKHKLNTYLHHPNTSPNTTFSTEQYNYKTRYHNHKNSSSSSRSKSNSSKNINENNNININNNNNCNDHQNNHKNQQRKTCTWIPSSYHFTDKTASTSSSSATASPSSWTRKRTHMHTMRSQPLISLGFMIFVSILPLLLLRSANAQNTSLVASGPLSNVTLARTGKVCKSLDLRNSPEEFSALDDCTVIEGFLLITVVNTGRIQHKEYLKSYPMLTEVTEYVVVYRVQHLASLGILFPNLSIIRGHNLFEGFALVIYSNSHLEELGLTKLSVIMRGGVRIENNEKLCFVDTVNWKAIAPSAEDNLILDNRVKGSCPSCTNCEYCWNAKTCQRVCPPQCPDNCANETTCCHESCIGGCSSDELTKCEGCRKFSFRNTCVDECPKKSLQYLTRRCITEEECLSIGTKFELNQSTSLVAFEGECSTNCPSTYRKIGRTCEFCGENCVRQCVGGLVDSVQQARSFHDCTHIITAGLTISIKRGGRHLMADLEYGFGSVQVIETCLKVHRSSGIHSLGFFKNLKLIKGDIMCEQPKFSFYVLENNDLESLWNINQTVNINNGSVFFHFNPKLCYGVIKEMRTMVKNATLNSKGDFDPSEVARDSNGSKASCNTTVLEVNITRISAFTITVNITTPMTFNDSRAFIGYQLYYVKDEYGNVTQHSTQSCDDSWNIGEPTKETKIVTTGLVPFTQYAYYVQSMTIASEPQKGQSPVKHFRTKSAKPQKVSKLVTISNSSSEITISWSPPARAFGNLTKYIVTASIEKTPTILSSKDFCSDQSAPETKNTTKKTVTTEIITPRNQDECDCRNTYKLDKDQLDTKIHEGMNFENLLQDFVYVKQTEKKKPADDSKMERQRRSLEMENSYADSFLVRHMRALPDESTTDSGKNSSSIKKGMKNFTNVMDPSNKYYEEFSYTVNANITEYVFTKLKHFAMYELSVSACRAPEDESTDDECSEPALIGERTLKLDNVDKVEKLQFELETTNTSRTNIRLRWNPPQNPNGEIISYIIYYQLQTPDAVMEKKCIVAKDFANMTQGYLLTGLSTGNYSVRVIVKSLAGMGVNTNALSVYIPPSKNSMLFYAIIVPIVLIVIIAIIVAVLCRKKVRPPSDLKMFPTVNPYYISLQYIPDEWEVERERVIQLSPLGQGSFGMVYEGIMKSLNSTTEDMPCAIKTVNENATDRERMNFLKEASVMKQFDTFHVVRLLGVCSVGQPALVIMELMKNGDLKSYLRKHRPDESDDDGINLVTQPPHISRIYQMAIEIADGMAYLAAKKFVHRDLAARNCMVASDLTVKIGDFGMTRDIYETDYYRKGTKGLLPVRWMPPESLRDGIYSTASDVFSYGVVLWEMATLASQPYQGLTNDQVLRYVIDGGIMERPENCPDKLYRLMQKCWHHRPTARPTFIEIIRFLLDLANSQFSDVSFYHSEEGQLLLNKELTENITQSEDMFIDHNHDMDDVTTPLRVGEYNEYNMNMGNNSSVEENPADADTVGHHAHSPFSLDLANTPDDRSKNSFNLSQTSQNNPTILSYVPSIQTPSQFSNSALFYISTGADKEVDEFSNVALDDRVGGDQSLLTSQTSKRIGIMPMSSSVPDPLSSYLQPSTASAASSNASSTTTQSAMGGGGGPSLKRTMAERMQNVGQSLMPSRLRLMNRLLSHRRSNSNSSQNRTSADTSIPNNSNIAASSAPLSHGLVTIESGESGSGSISSHLQQPKFYTPVTSTTIPSSDGGGGGGGGDPVPSEIESPMSTAPVPAISTTTTTSTPKIKSKHLSSMLTSSANPNYQILDESLNATTSSSAQQLASGSGSGSRLKTSANPNYELMQATGSGGPTLNINTTPDPSTNYVLMTSPQDAAMRVSENPNYQATAKPAHSLTERVRIPPAFSPPIPSNWSIDDGADDDDDDDGSHAHDNFGDDQMRPLSKERSTGSVTSKEEHSGSASRRRRGSGSSRSRQSQSRSQSRSRRRSKGDNNDSTSEKSLLMTSANKPAIDLTKTASASATTKATPTTTFSLKEKWLQQQQQPPPPPPNGFIGRDN